MANGTPIILRDLFGKHFDSALDAGILFFDGQPLLGGSKTWRGVFGSIILTTVAAISMGYAAQIGVAVGLLAMSGDLCASFIKRRLKLQPSSMAPLLDQVPEALLPAYMMQQIFSLDAVSMTVLIIAFIIFELSVSVLLYRIGIRKRPY